MIPNKICRHLPLLCAAALAVSGNRVGAQAETSPDSSSAFFDAWTATVHAAQASQPGWITPLATTTPRLEEEIRYDQDAETLRKGEIDIYDGGKGLELIPTGNTEVIITAPPYQVRTGSEPSSGFNDWPGILLKYRVLSANAASGDYIVTVFAQYGIPTGIAALTNDNHVFTPTLALGKGFGDFDIQATVGEAIPTRDYSNAGRAIATNITAQYHIAKLFWPEVEMNRTDWRGGARDGRSQTYITTGLVVGRIVLNDRSKLIFGAGYQTAVSHVYAASPMTPTFNHNWIFSTRVTF
jgi:hypothetical protein